MKKAHWYAIVDALMVVVMLTVLFIGVLLGFFIGRGAGPQAEKYLWGLHRHDWGDLHLIFSLTLVALVILHFILHMGWIRCMSKQCLGLHWLVTLPILFVLAAGIVAASVAIKRAYPGPYGQEERGFGPGRVRRVEDPTGAPRGERRGGARRRGLE